MHLIHIIDVSSFGFGRIPESKTRNSYDQYSKLIYMMRKKKEPKEGIFKFLTIKTGKMAKKTSSIDLKLTRP